MTIGSATSRVSYTGNGSVDTYSYPFKIFSQSDLELKVQEVATGEETTLVIATDYTVTGSGEASGGTCVLVDNNQDWIDAEGDLATGWKLVIRRKRSLLQDIDIGNQGPYYARTHETAFDKLTMNDQQQQDELDHKISLPDTVEVADFNPELPADIVGAANKIPTINEDGDGWAPASEWTSLDDLEQASVDAATAAAAAAAAASSAADAQTAETNAETAETNAETAESNAETAATAAAASAVAAAASAVAAAASAAAASMTNSAYQVSGSKSAPNAIVAGTGITFTPGINRMKIYVEGSGGAVDVSANPQIQAGTIDGQEMMLVGCDDTNTVLLEEGTGLSLFGSALLMEGDILVLNWDDDSSLWEEVSRSF